jgi:hypothetical protein
MPNLSIEGNLTLTAPNERLLWMGILYELNECYDSEEEYTTNVVTNLVTL